ncbi:bacteriophytochrome BphP [Xanthomonas albilineans]|uniref:bacteriophytochrome BphP n=1 Tax=Xanthomonas albilineans TaxID=29447 RepID=UPI0005F34BCB|nr:bacteriophytochrome BphP [Xanthomonas albilineans]
MSDSIAPLDMDACAREPIHIPGSVQPYGVLLVIEPSDGCIVQASATAADLFGQPLEELLRQRYDSILAVEDPRTRLLPDATEPSHLAYVDIAFRHDTAMSAQRWVGAWHLYPEQWLLELELRDAPLADATLREALPVLRRLESDTNIEDACQRAAKSLRALIGYDRVMIYRFDEEWNGDVVAEARAAELEPYLGLHYPATDIPAQARALYLRNRVRQIVDVGYMPSPIQPTLHPRLHAPLDLSDVSLRSVSPVHLEYLANMGVTATLVTSIVVNDALWGLVACHHYRPYFCNHEMRDVADAVSRALAGRIGALTAVARARTESMLLTLREKLITNFNDAEMLTASMLDEMASDLLDVVDADGVAVFHGDHVTRHGMMPAIEDLARIREQIEDTHHEALRHDAVGALHTDQIGQTFPALADLAPLAAGFIFVPLMPQSRSALLWTRREQVRTVNWAGNPQLAKLQDIPDSRLSPRKSFDLWQETVRGRAQPWSPLSLESARSLRVLIELMERKRFQQDFVLLEASLSRLREPVAIVERGSEQRPSCLVFVNDAFASLYQREVAELIGCALDRLYASDAVPEETQRIATLLRQGRAAYVTLPLRVDGAVAVHRQFDFEPLPNPSGIPTHWLLQLRDPR